MRYVYSSIVCSYAVGRCLGRTQHLLLRRAQQVVKHAMKMLRLRVVGSISQISHVLAPSATPRHTASAGGRNHVRG